MDEIRLDQRHVHDLNRGIPPLKLSGLEPLIVTPESNFINIGERTNVAGSKKFLTLIKTEHYEEALQIARDQVEGGAQIIDVNMDDGMLDGAKAMTVFLNLIAAEPDICRVPIMIDSSKWEIIEAGLKVIQGKSVVNSISLKAGEKEFIRQAGIIRKYGAAIVVMAFDEKGQADTTARRIEICERSYRLLADKVRFPVQDIIFDPNIFPVATGMDEHRKNAISFFQAAKWVRENLPGSHVSGGVSNVSFSFRGNDRVREAMHSAFLYHGIRAGMDMGILNPNLLEVYDRVPKELLEKVEDVLWDRRKDATERLLDFATTLDATVGIEKKRVKQWRTKPVADRLSYALVKGVDSYLKEDIEEVLHVLGTPLAVIEGPLMTGMNEVGDLFGSGKMFLPQVVKSARVMKKSVAFLTPLLEREKETTYKNAGKILMATVKGDVHDIGKNIVSVVLACNNYEIIDMGVMMPADKILQKAVEERVDAIGLSALITPSLDEIVYVAKEMTRQKLTIPLLIGGATTSRVHTAVKIAPAYSGSVIHVLDASKSVQVMHKLMHHQKKKVFVAEIEDEYHKIRLAQHRGSTAKKRLTLKQARANKLSVNWKADQIATPRFIGEQVFRHVDLEQVIPCIDWTPFFKTWGLRGRYPALLQDDTIGVQANNLLNDARSLLRKIVAHKWLTAKAVVAIYPANTTDDDIEVFESEDRKSVKATFRTLRQQSQKAKTLPNIALADFIAPRSTGIKDYMGFFCVTSGVGIEEVIARFEAEHDDYNTIMVKALADRLAEALAEWMHRKIRTTLWGYAPSEHLSNEELIKESYRGIRPAPGYPACPDHTEKITLFKLLQVEKNIGVTLTENLAMLPASSVSGFYFAHPQSSYFGLGKIGKDQVNDYAQRKNMSVSETEKWLAPHLSYVI